jgi:hypothetical protein
MNWLPKWIRQHLFMLVSGAVFVYVAKHPELNLGEAAYVLLGVLARELGVSFSNGGNSSTNGS